MAKVIKVDPDAAPQGGISLLERYRNAVSKHKDVRMRQEATPDVQYATGFPVFDFLNGSKVTMQLPDGQVVEQYSVGIVDGSMCMFIGRSGCGKTTFAVQVAANIAKQFPKSEIFHDDIEGGIADGRRISLTGWSSEMIARKYRIRDTGITAENFYESISTIRDIKMTNYDDYSYRTGQYDIYGNEIIKLEPTLYILDSVAMLMPGQYTEEEELSGQMSSTAAAKMNSMSFKRIVPMLKSAGIILILINHINEDVNIGPFQKPTTLSYLKPGETLPGGRTIGYLTNLLLRFDDNAKLKEKEGLAINGSVVDVTLVKSRTGRSGAKCSLVFEYERGFDPDLSMYLMLKNNDLIGGSGQYLYIKGHTEIKFAQRDVRKLLASDLEFRRIFIETSVALLKSTVQTADKSSTYSFDLSDDIMSMLKVA